MNNKYKEVYFPEHHRAKTSGAVYEHMLVAEEMLGRRLRKSEVVHHEDGNKSNNSPDNIYVFKNQSHHARYHKTGVKEKSGDVYIAPKKCNEHYIKNCELCLKEFNSTRYNYKYCSRECAQVASRIVERPDKDKLYEMLKIHPFTHVAGYFGVSDNAVRKWCRKYNIPSNSKYYKEKYR